MEAFFQFTHHCGRTAAPTTTRSTAPITLGSTLVATNATSDFTLLQLSQTPPPGAPSWAGPPRRSSIPATDLYRISHPGGAPQAYSQHDDGFRRWSAPDGPAASGSTPRTQVGATEGGSSGSPVVNAAGQVVGQLSGGCGYDVYNTCNNIDNSTVDGAFAAYYDQVAPWLGSGGPCTDADGDGYCAAASTTATTATPDVNPGATEICDDGIDNNCDGTVDEGCGAAPMPTVTATAPRTTIATTAITSSTPAWRRSAATGSTTTALAADEECPTCLPAGEPCSLGSECCSRRCHPRKHTCK